jgi:hypothetical protein
VDRSALDYAYSIQGAHATKAQGLRRQAGDLSRQACELIAQADLEDERATWAGQMAEALSDDSAEPDASL